MKKRISERQLKAAGYKHCDFYTDMLEPRMKQLRQKVQADIRPADSAKTILQVKKEVRNNVITCIRAGICPVCGNDLTIYDSSGFFDESILRCCSKCKLYEKTHLSLRL